MQVTALSICSFLSLYSFILLVFAHSARVQNNLLIMPNLNLASTANKTGLRAVLILNPGFNNVSTTTLVDHHARALAPVSWGIVTFQLLEGVYQTEHKKSGGETFPFISPPNVFHALGMN